MVKEAEKFSDEDKKKKEEVEVRNTADSLVYTTEKTLSDLKDKITPDMKAKIEPALKALKDAIAGKDTEKIKQESENLGKAIQEIGASIYQQPGAQAGEGASAAPGFDGGAESATEEGAQEPHKKKKGKGKEEAIDAEYKVEDEKK